ncbi:hypothetical protein [Tsukamurella tyrosinosolvens]
MTAFEMFIDQLRAERMNRMFPKRQLHNADGKVNLYKVVLSKGVKG